MTDERTGERRKWDHNLALGPRNYENQQYHFHNPKRAG